MPLRQQQAPLLRALATQIELIWTEYLALSDYPLSPEFGYIEGQVEGQSLVIENICYQAPPFRKLHLELAQVGKGLDILKCTMFPEPNYDLPIFGTDLVGGRAGMSTAMADLSPVTANRKLSVEYHQYLNHLPALEVSVRRQLPECGKIFSEFCLFLRPRTPEEEARFLARVVDYLRWHCQQAVAAQPIPECQTIQVLTGQRNYCQQQQKNDKIRRILSKAFGEEWAEHYMKTVLFDSP